MPGLARCRVALCVLAINGAGSAAIASEALTTNQPADSLSFVDLATMKEVARIEIGGKPAGIALSPDRTKAYVTAPDSKELVEVDATARRVTRHLVLGGAPLGIAAHPTRPELFVAVEKPQRPGC